ncbi:hypothetical protein FHW69_003079 [Luteibacter sp. Sphag1AF]|uniref:hypothetical protein n=1 Tax=Luteibacter sp. Sphag1AF TaxID=2587031 RepID=UPI001843B844|nr:hypothetical protein [Luteibacter sp. Sphag1AF]MBB3228444.1 hypothetical protein [Luteibacter sp. Sphag1AF]
MELLVAVALGLLVSAAAVAWLTSTMRAAWLRTRQAQTHEEGRFAMTALLRGITQVGSGDAGGEVAVLGHRCEAGSCVPPLSGFPALNARVARSDVLTLTRRNKDAADLTWRWYLHRGLGEGQRELRRCNPDGECATMATGVASLAWRYALPDVERGVRYAMAHEVQALSAWHRVRGVEVQLRVRAAPSLRPAEEQVLSFRSVAALPEPLP